MYYISYFHCPIELIFTSSPISTWCRTSSITLRCIIIYVPRTIICYLCTLIFTRVVHLCNYIEALGRFFYALKTVLLWNTVVRIYISTYISLYALLYFVYSYFLRVPPALVRVDGHKRIQILHIIIMCRYYYILWL